MTDHIHGEWYDKYESKDKCEYCNGLGYILETFPNGLLKENHKVCPKCGESKVSHT